MNFRIREGINSAMYLSICFSCVLWLLFSLSFTRRTQWLTWKIIAAICFIPTITTLFAITNPLHGFMFGESIIRVEDGKLIVIKEFNFWFWIHTAYSYALVFVGSVFIVAHVMSKDNNYRNQGFVMIGGAVIPFVANLLFLGFREEFLHLDITPLAMSIATAFFAWGIFKYRLFDLVPLARSTVFDCLDDPVFILDTQQRIADCNPSASSFLNTSKAELMGHPFPNIFPYPTDILNDPHASVDEISFDSDEGTMHFVITAKKISGKKEEYLGYLISLHDISSLKRHETALMDAKERAESATASKSDFLATMSHEIRTPMNGVLGFTSLLQDTPLNGEQRSYVDTIQSSGKTLLTLINDILDHSKIEAGKIALEYRPFFVHTCIEEALDAVIKPATQKHLDLSLYIDPNVPTAVMGDSTRLIQILINLLSNAVKFTEEGEIIVEVTCLEIPIDDEAPYLLRFSVQDTGIGIPQHQLDTIFDSFTQADSSMTRRFGGTGLGLAIAKRLCEMMGGKIFAENNDSGNGSLFYFTIQAREVPESQPFAEKVSTLRHLPGHQILFASTNRTRQKYLHTLCNSWSMSVQIVANIDEVSSLLKSGHAFDALLIDPINYPSDIEQLDRLKEEQVFECPLFVLLSLNHSAEPLSRHITEIIHKPIKYNAMYDALTKHLADFRDLPVTSFSEFEETLGLTHPLSILVAEDDQINQELALLFFQRLGYSPDIVANGKEAIKAVSNRQYDVVFMDIYMPELDGLSASKTIRNQAHAGMCPVLVAMTASVTHHDRLRCSEAKMDGFISKPIDIKKLSRTLKQVKKIRKETVN